MDDQTTKTSRIAEQNDRFRQEGASQTLQGYLIVTQGISALPYPTVQAILARVMAFDDFSEDNDPHGEHDFGAFDVDQAGKVFWKIDYYAGDELEFGSDDPSDPAQTFRVLTIMLASEY